MDEIQGKRINLRLIGLSAVGLVAITLIICLRSVLTPVAIALVLAYIAEPLLRLLGRYHIRRWVSTVLLYLLCLLLLTLAAVTIGPRIGQQAQRLYHEVAGVADNYGSSILAQDGEQDSGPAEEQTSDDKEAGEQRSRTQGVFANAPLSEWAGEVRQYLRSHADQIASRVVEAVVTTGRNVLKSVSNAAGFFFGLVLVLVFTFFFMLNFQDMVETVKRYIPAAHRDRTLHILHRIDAAVSNFFRGRLLVCLIAGIVYVTGLRLARIDFWLLIGVTGGLLGFIPVLGVILPFVPACAFALLTDHPWGSLIGVVLTFSVVQWVVEPVAGTLILSRQVKMHPVTIILSLLIGGSLFGMLGMLLSVPLAAVVRILGEEFVLPPLRELAGQEVQRPREEKDTAP